MHIAGEPKGSQTGGNVMSNNNMVYIRTDKNGTKIYHDYTCPRCGGAGGADQWIYTGWTCYECGGTGRVSKPQIIKEYTPEYRAKLDERARKRAEVKRTKQVEEFNNNRLAIAEKYGFNPEGKIYVVLGNTYEIREELKEAGAKYRGGINWYFLEKQDKYSTIELSYEECLNIYPEYGTMSWKDLTEVQAVLNSKIPTEEDPSQYVGQVGDRLDLVVIFKKRSTYDIPSYAGWGTDTVGINVFRDDAGNCFIWKSTSAFFNIAEGSKVRLRGTVKEHSDYKGTKQTILQRCKVDAVKL